MDMRKRSKDKLKVAVGLSGGVDSAVAASLLMEQGFNVTGVHLECWSEPGCRASQDRKDALAVAMHLGIPFEVLDYQKEYKEKVMEYFYKEYEAGRTPNPDVMCNLEIKFGLFMQWALLKGFDYLATGHYARIREPIKNSKLKIKNYSLLTGRDKTKDQTYFLYRLNQEQLKRILFPVGDMTKGQVRAKARKLKLPVAGKPDSQGICFIGEVNVQEFLKRRIREKKGEVVMYKNSTYYVIGSHRGVWFYTIGQRVGLKLRINKKLGKKLGLDPTKLPPLYVVDKNIGRNRLVLGTKEEAGRNEFKVGEVHWINQSYKLPRQRTGRHVTTPEDGQASLKNLLVRIRHGGKLILAEITTYNEYVYSNIRINEQKGKKEIKERNGDRLSVHLKEYARGIAPGQSAVFYKDEECLGGAVIQ
jgi:tRNA-specific 2-thiouridylase